MKTTYTDADIGTHYTVITDYIWYKMKWFMSIFDPIFASTAFVRFPQRISAMVYF